MLSQSSYSGRGDMDNPSLVQRRVLRVRMGEMQWTRQQQEFPGLWGEPMSTRGRKATTGREKYRAKAWRGRRIWCHPGESHLWGLAYSLGQLQRMDQGGNSNQFWNPQSWEPDFAHVHTPSTGLAPKGLGTEWVPVDPNWGNVGP